MGKKTTNTGKGQSGGKGKGKGVHKGIVKRIRPGISMEQYEKMLASFMKHRDISRAAKDAGVARTTAIKYIKEGRPERGMPAIKDQSQKVDERAQEMQKLTLAQFRADYLDQVIEALGTSDIELKLHRVWAQQKAIDVQKQDYEVEYENGEPKKDANGNLVYLRDQNGQLIPKRIPPSLSFNLQVRAHDTLVRLGERALGAADETLGASGEENILAELTREEKLDYLMTGKLPMRYRK